MGHLLSKAPAIHTHMQAHHTGHPLQLTALNLAKYTAASASRSSVWVAFASSYLDKAPGRPARLSSLINPRYCILGKVSGNDVSLLGVHDHETQHVSHLEKLCQTDSVAEYKAAHDVLAAQISLPMKLRLFQWERVLKDDIRVMCSLDPLTHKQCARH